VRVESRKRLLLYCVLLIFFVHSLAFAESKEVRRVLIINEMGPAIDTIDHEIVSLLEKMPYPVEFQIENMDTSLFPNEDSQRQLRDWYSRKYRNIRLDLIIAAGPAPLVFMAESHHVFSPGTPILFCGYNVELVEPPRLDSDFTGVWMVLQPDDTLEAALHLQPGTKHLVVVGGASPFDRRIQALVKERIRPYESQLDFTYLTDLPMPDLLERLKHLPSNTVVLHAGLLQDGAGRRFIDATQSVPMITKAASAPVFVLDDVGMGSGAVGGNVFSYSRTGRVLAEMAVRVLDGERPRDIPIVESTSVSMFDWRAMQRWGLKEGNAPQGSVIINRQPTLWEVYKKYIVGIVSIILAETVLIVALLWNRARRREAQRLLARSIETVRESEERFRLVANTAPVMIWMSGVDRQCNYFNQPWLQFTGRCIEAELGDGWAEGVHPEDQRGCLDTYVGAFERRETFSMHYRLRRHDGEYRWMFDLGVPRFSQDGSFAGYIGSCLDVTERKLAEEALAGVGRRLIEAHEEERTWIARELHDDINQRIALLTIVLEKFAQDLPESNPELNGHLGYIRQGLYSLARDIQSLSHRLHSSKLDYLGLAGAASSFCKELSEQHKVGIHFSHAGIPVDVPKEVSLSLFRVLQEALQNAVKYSGQGYFRAELRGTPEEILLTVTDQGVGFDQRVAIGSRGLGLISMRERMQLIGGQFSIESEPGHGTTISARVHLQADEHRARAAG